MKALRQVSIRGKMLVGFAAVILLVGLGDLYGLVSTGRLAEEASIGGARSFRKVIALTEVEGLVHRLANAAATATPEAQAQAAGLRREVGRTLQEARAAFPADRALGAEFDDLERRLDQHLARSGELAELAARGEWAALRPLLEEFQQGQGELLRQVAAARSRCAGDLETSQRTLALRTLGTFKRVSAVTGLALVAALAIALRLSGEIVGPLRRLQALMGSARAGDFSLRAEEGGGGETAALSQGLNELLEHLERRDAELELHRHHLEQRVEERTVQLEVANQMLQAELSVRSAAEAAVAESEQRLRRVLDSVRAGIVIVDAERRVILDANAFALELMGTSREAVVGRPCHGTLCPGDELCPLDIEGNALEDAEGRLLREDGWCVPILRSVAPVTHQGRLHLVESFVDLSEVKRQEQALRQSEQRYRTLFASARDAIFVLDARPDAPARIIDLNPAAAGMHGYEVEELRGHPFGDVDGGHLLTDGRGETIRSGLWIEAEITHRRRDGCEFPVQVTAGPLDVGDGRYVLVFGRDVTEQRRAREALESFNEKLRRSNQDLEEFAYVASHDLQEPLRKVQAFGDRLKARHGDALADQGRDYLDRMQGAARRMQELIEGLLTFSRVTTQAQPFAAVDLGRVAREVLSDLEVRIEQTAARVEVGDLPTLEADPLQMRQLIQNLVGNALKFRKPGEPPVVRIRAEAGETGDAGRPAVQLIVEDEGIGFEPRYAERIFGVFQRLQGRGEYEGTGVGLAVCRKIAERHGGSIVARGTPGAGARFTVTLPVKGAHA